MAVILSSKKSTYGSPYAYYTVSVATESRTASAVKFEVTVTGKLAESVSFLGTGKSLVAGLYVNGSWHTKTLKSTSASWSGSTSHSVDFEFTVSGLSAAQTSISGIKFRVLRGDTTGDGAQLNSTSCSSVSISKYATATTPNISVSSATLGSTSVKITTDGNISSLTHKLYYSVGSSGLVYIATIGDSSYTWMPPLEIAKYITTATSGTATITCKTYSGSTLIGIKTKTLTLNVPSTVVPQLTATVNDPKGYRTDYGSYLVGKSRYKVSMTETTAYGAAISSRSITMNGETFTSKDPTSSLLKGTNFNSIEITITDTRGRRATYSISDLPAAAYARPAIKSFATPLRCTVGGTADEDGDNIKTKLDYSYDSLGGKNSATAVIEIIRDSDGQLISSVSANSGTEYILPAPHGITYSIAYKVCDMVSGTDEPATARYTLISGKAVFSAKKGCQVAIGKSAERGTPGQPVFESAWHTVLPSLDVGDVDYTLTDTEISTLLELLGGVAPKLIDYIYPVGSVIYSSNGGFNPNDLYSHQTWERIKDRFILAAGDTYLAGSMGGEAKHVLTAAELPSHTHTAKGRSVYAGGGTYTALCATGQSDTNYLINSGGGEGAAHNNMPPYKAVYVWERTA